MEKLSLLERFGDWVKKSVTLKILIIGILILILLIPSSLMSSLISERERTRDEAIAEVSSQWGSRQTIGGPVITVPFTVSEKDEKGKTTTRIEYAHFLPENLKIEGNILPEERKRGIYLVVLYNVKLKISGSFRSLNFEILDIPRENLMLNDAFLSIGISDMKGIKDNIQMKWNDSTLSFNPGIVSHDIFSSGVSVPIRLDKENFNFDCNLDINGSSDLNFLPFGKETVVNLKSSWGNPGFTGSFLPESRKVEASGFVSKWKVLQLNRNYAQQGIGSYISTNSTNPSISIDYSSAPSYSSDEASFGVKLLLPIDEYQKTMRSAKYNIMFICLTFLTFFFVEILNKKRIHPIQYLLVGFAVCLFYILLLSISEHLSFDYAYLIGCIVILGLVTLYAKAIFKSNFLTLLISGVLAILYGFFYSLLQLQDYALLLGSVGLLLILGIIMYLTRNIDWYKVQE